MTERTVYECDACHEREDDRDWIVAYSVVRRANTVYQTPKKETLHGCFECYTEHYEHVDTSIDDHGTTKHVKAWCRDRNTITGVLVGRNTDIERCFDFVPREDFTEDQESVATFLDTLL